MEKKIRVSAVSYLNAKPFVYGLQNSEILKQTELSLDHPAECARKLISMKADIGLVPVAVIEKIPNGEIISDYCIAANGEVASVLLLSNVPLEKIESVLLDQESRTSVLLVKVLAHFFWNIKPQWIDERDVKVGKSKNHTAVVVIGDRALALRNAYQYKFDLASEWKKFTGLPFVFACWATNTNISQDYLQKFNKALEFGLQNRSGLIATLSNNHYDVRKYLTENIQYVMDEEKRKAMREFLSLAKQIEQNF